MFIGAPIRGVPLVTSSEARKMSGGGTGAAGCWARAATPRKTMTVVMRCTAGALPVRRIAGREFCLEANTATVRGTKAWRSGRMVSSRAFLGVRTDRRDRSVRHRMHRDVGMVRFGLSAAQHVGGASCGTPGGGMALAPAVLMTATVRRSPRTTHGESDASVRGSSNAVDEARCPPGSGCTVGRRGAVLRAQQGAVPDVRFSRPEYPALRSALLPRRISRHG